MALGWTIIYRTGETEVDSTTMLGSHDGKDAWSEAEIFLNKAHPSEKTSVVAIIKGMNPAFIKNRDS